MNLLLLAPQPFYQERGTPIAVKLLAQTLAEQGHAVHLLVFAEGEDITIPGVTIHRHIRLPGISNIKPGLSLKKIICDFFLLFKSVSLIRKHDFHLIHAVEEAVFIAYLVKRIFNIPYVYDMDSCLSVQIIDKFPKLGLLRNIMQWLEKRAIAASIGVLAVCQALEDIVKKHVPDKLTAKIEDITLLDAAGDGQEQLRQELGIDGILLMYVGNLEKYQGVDLLLAGFQKALLRQENLALVFIGGSPEDVGAYRQQAKELGIASKVFFCGPRPVNMLGFYLSQADILVSPRTQGSNTPMKIYSYLDSGKAVLATNLSTHTQVLDETIAFLVDPEPEALADGIIALAGDSGRRETLGVAARQRVQEEYSLTAFQRKLRAFYEQLQGGIDSRST